MNNRKRTNSSWTTTSGCSHTHSKISSRPQQPPLVPISQAPNQNRRNLCTVRTVRPLSRCRSLRASRYSRMRSPWETQWAKNTDSKLSILSCPRAFAIHSKLRLNDLSTVDWVRKKSSSQTLTRSIAQLTRISTWLIKCRSHIAACPNSRMGRKDRRNSHRCSNGWNNKKIKIVSHLILRRTPWTLLTPWIRTHQSLILVLHTT